MHTVIAYMLVTKLLALSITTSVAEEIENKTWPSPSQAHSTTPQPIPDPSTTAPVPQIGESPQIETNHKSQRKGIVTLLHIASAEYKVRSRWS